MFAKTRTNHRQRSDFETTLRGLGAVNYDLWLPESHTLLGMLYPGEVVTAIVYGHYIKWSNTKQANELGRGALVSTSERMLLIDKKPSFLRCDEIGYGVVNAVTYSRAGVAGTVTVHTKIGDILLKTLNKNCANNFVKAIEARIFKVN